MDEEVLQLIQRSLRISALTQGAFDITYGLIDKSLWNFNVNMTSLPDAETAMRSVRLINYNNVQMDTTASTVMLKKWACELALVVLAKAMLPIGIS